MIRLALTLGLAGSFASSVFAQVVPQAGQQKDLPARPHLQILGTLDPSTGTFKPDVSPSGMSDIRGQINLVFDLDATHFDSVSIVCDAVIQYQLGMDQTSLDATQIFPKFDQKRDKFIDTLPFDFHLPVSETSTPRARVIVTCRYLNDSAAEVYHGTFKLPLHSGSVDLAIGGVMDGTTY